MRARGVCCCRNGTQFLQQLEAVAVNAPFFRVKALEALLQQRERFDYILIETTGVWQEAA